MIFIAKRFIFSNKFQTLFIILGIAVGISVQCFIAILIDSLQATLINSSIGSSPHIVISPQNESSYLEINDKFLEDIDKIKDVTNIQKEYQENVFVKTSEDDSSDNALLMKGLEFNSKSEIYKLKDNLIEGNLPKSEKQVIIGKEFAEKKNVKVDDSLFVNFSDFSNTTVQVTGIFDLKNSALNERWIIVNLDWMQQLRGKVNKLNDINLQVKDPFKADLIAEKVKDLGYVKSDSLTVENWKETNAQLLSGLQGQSISSIFIQVFALISVVIGIISVLNILVIQKSKEIGILKAMGLKDRQSGWIFVIQSAFLGTIGTFFGILLGLGLFLAFVTFVKTDTGDPIVDPVIKWQFFAVTVLINITVSAISGLIPAVKTSKLDPVQIINNG